MPSQTPAPEHIIRVGDADAHEHPLLGQLLGDWATKGFDQNADVHVLSTRAEAKAEVQSFRERVPGYSWPSPDAVILRFQNQTVDITFDLYVSYTPCGDT